MNEEDGIDLIAVVRSLRRGWWIILLVAVVAVGAAIAAMSLLPPKYEATAIVSVPSDLTLLSVADALRSDVVEVKVTGMLVPSQDEINDIAIKVSPDSKNAFLVTAEGLTAQRAAAIANAWAAAGVEAVNGIVVTPRKERLDKAEQALSEADEALVGFLAAKGLQDVSWLDLVAFTGIGQTQPSLLQGVPDKLSSLSTANRLILTDLMRTSDMARLEQATAYAELRSMETAMAESGGARVLSQALPPTEPSGLSLAFAAVLAGLAGILMGSLLAVIADTAREKSRSAEAV